MKRSEGITMLACWHFVGAGLFVVALLIFQGVLMLLWHGQFDLAPGEGTIMVAVLVGFSFLVGTLAILFFVTGLGLWRQRPWARKIAIVLACLELVKFPAGTVIGFLTLWYLLNHDDLKEPLRIENQEVSVAG